MPGIKDYLSPLVAKNLNLQSLFKSFKWIFPIMWHGILPHKNAESPVKELPDIINPNNDSEILQTTIIEIYKEANERIDNLEEKAFKLLTYISALSALILYFLSKLNHSGAKILIIISIFLLFIAILLSLRCIGTKTRRTIFIDSIFDFNSQNPTQKDSNKIRKSYLDCAIYNQTVADNTADILKASRYFLTLAFLIAFIGVSLNIFSMDFSDSSNKETHIILSDSVTFRELNNSIHEIQKTLDSALILNAKYLEKSDTDTTGIILNNSSNANTQQ